MDYMSAWQPNWKLNPSDMAQNMAQKGMETTSELLHQTMDKIGDAPNFFYKYIFDQSPMTQLIRSVVFTFAFQLIAGYLPHLLAGKERQFHIMGGLNFILLTAFTFFTQPDWGLRKIIVSAMVTTWATRLMSYLFIRSRVYLDKRFAAIRNRPVAKLLYWLGQALWVSICMLPVILLNSEDTPQSQYTVPGLSIPRTINTPVGTVKLPSFMGKIRGPGRKAFWGRLSFHNLNALDYIGFAMWGIGFVMEAVADYQKYKFHTASPAEKEKMGGPFLRTGLWKFTRHPNYLGEIVMWTGIYLSCVNSLSGWQHIAVLSPLFVAFTILAVSGVPLNEDSKERQFGANKDYQDYKQKTSLLLPFVF